MKNLLTILTLAVFILASGCSDEHIALRKERKAIQAGNSLYEQGRYAEAAEYYKDAIEKNPNSMEALYDLSLANLKRSETVESDSLKQQLKQVGLQGLQTVAASSVSDQTLAGKAVYNLGNIAFEGQKYSEAIEAYKQALRYNPTDNNARRNLRIAQLQQQDQNEDQNQDNQNQNEDKQDEQNQEDKEDQQNQQDQQVQQEKSQDQQPSQPQINEQSAEQILQSIDNRENQIRARMMQGQEASSNNSSNRRW